MKNRNIFLGAVLVILGLLWFLNNLNIFDYNMRYLITAFTRLWPLIIVFVGAGLIVQNKTVERILWVVFLLVIIGYSIFLQVGNPFSNNIDNNGNNGIPGQENRVEDDYSYPMAETISEGELQLRIGATRFQLDSGSSEDLLSLNTTIDDLYVELDDVTNGVAEIDINNRGNVVNIGDSSDNELNLTINEDIPWSIDMESGAVDAELDLSHVSLTKMDLALGAGKMSVRLGDSLEHSVFNMKSGVSQVDIYIPESAALVIHMNGALNSTNIDGLNLAKEGNTYTSTNHLDGANTIELNLEVGLGEVQFHRY
ncbi:hypothetical protein J0B03_11100 [Alkalibacter rhizosphaerae]|uniref:LiaI-LiaF-like transmembrane region domain-containing protein n=1 Tax=Alkalibacter rhizosphaerae TaxID=2815577 RepID=A0A975AIA2_9FIRM|nr:DUF5668 domain-containing protein [Alkalibacter rhizosphaerae]QSX08320.1 hypothetical protein J0B03_11100 [Alkalibacter rhizosphaerae]